MRPSWRDRRWLNCSSAWRAGATPRLLIEKAMLPAWAILISFIESAISGFSFTDNANSTQRWIVNRP